MRNIAKEAEPESLTQYRAANATDYDGYPDKDGLRISLVTEQRGICCYCMGRVRAMIGSTRSSIGRPIANTPSSALSTRISWAPAWEKKAAVVPTSTVIPTKATKTSRGTPQTSPTMSRPSSASSPTGASPRPIWPSTRDLEHVLNLNMPALTNSRKETLRAFQRTLEKRGTLSREAWEKLLGQLDGASQTGDLMPYCQVIVYWIRKKLARVAN